MIWRLLGLIGELLRRRSVVAPTAARQPIRHVHAGLYVAFGFLVAGLTLYFLHSGAWVVGGIGAALAVIAGTMMEVTQPDRAGYMRFGRYVGPLDPGWHFPIGGIMECCHVPGKEIKVNLPDESVYTKEETDLVAKYLVTIRLGDTDEDLKRAVLRLTRKWEETMDLFQKIAAGELRTVLGKRSFRELNEEQEKLELEAKLLLENDFAEYGFKVISVKIYDFTEETKSEAARILAQGLARANVRIKEAEAFKDNYPLALASVGTVVADALSGSNRKGRGKKDDKEGGDEKKDDDAQNPVVAAVTGATEAVRDVIGGRRKRRS